MKQIALIKDKSAVITVGLPGCGKTKYGRETYTDHTCLEKQLLRLHIFYTHNPSRFFSWEKWNTKLDVRVDDVFNKRLEKLAKENCNVVLTDNWLNQRDRLDLILRLQELGFNVHVVFFDIPLLDIQAANQVKVSKIPVDVMDKFYLEHMAYVLKCHRESKHLGYTLEIIK